MTSILITAAIMIPVLIGCLLGWRRLDNQEHAARVAVTSQFTRN